MTPRRTFAVMGRVLSGLRHDPRTVAMALFAPLIIMTLFGFALSGEVVDAPVVVYDADDTNVTRDIVDQWGVDRAVDVERVDSEPEARQRVQDREAWVALVIPRGFTADQMAGRGDNLTLFVDATNPQIVQAASEALRDAILDTTGGVGGPPLDTVRVYGRDDARAFDYIVPGLVPFVVFFFATLLTIISLVRERSEGTLTRTLSTPATPGDLVLGYLFAFSILATIQTIVVVSVSLVLFDVQLAGTVWELFVVVLLVAFLGLGLGTFLSTAARNELQAIQFIPLVVLPALLLSGVIWPIESMPGWLKPVAYAIPLTYAVRAARDVMSRGLALSEVPLDVAVVAGFAVVAVILAMVVMRREHAT